MSAITRQELGVEVIYRAHYDALRLVKQDEAQGEQLIDLPSPWIAHDLVGLDWNQHSKPKLEKAIYHENTDIEL
jgi:hypothetical protein